MPIKQFSIGFSRTINLGNYESARVEASVTIETEAGNDYCFDMVDAAQGDLSHLLKETMRTQFPITTPKKDNHK